MKMYFQEHEGSALSNHARDKHEGEEKPQYVMKILKYWDSTFRRLIHEGVRVHRIPERRCCGSKLEVREGRSIYDT